MELAVGLFFKVLFLIEGEPKISPQLQTTIDLYKGEGFGETFALIRAWDAPYEPVEKLIGKSASVIDLGSGDGLLGNYLAIGSAKRKVFGIELNSDRAKIANKGIKNARFTKGNILEAKIPAVDAVTLVHVLHHLPSRHDQEILLARISKSLKKGKDLIILEIDTQPFLKYVFTWLTDAITVPILFEGRAFSTDFYYRKSHQWKQLLTNLGFSVSIKPIHKGMPFSHVLIHAKKK